MRSNAERLFSDPTNWVKKHLPSWNRVFLTKAFFFAALLIFTAFQALAHFQPFVDPPVRDDDVYSYIVKAVEVSSGCLLSDCQSLQDLKPQLTSVAQDPDIAGLRNRLYHRLFVFYHPLQSGAMVLMQNAGLSLETAYNLLYDLVKILLPLAVAYWLFSVWGSTTAALTMLLLTPVLFPSHGLHVVAMHTFALLFAFFLWAEIASRTRRVDYLFLPLLIAMLLAHPLGKLLALCSLIFYVFEHGWPLPKRAWAVVGSGSGLLLLSFLLPAVISRPELNFDPLAFYPGSWNFLAGLRQGLADTWTVIADWARAFGSPLFLAGLAFLGLLTLPRTRLFRILGQGTVILGLVVASMLYVVPWYGSISFVRVWPILAVLLTAAFAGGLVALIGYAGQLAALPSSKRREAPLLPAKFDRKAPGWGLLLALVIAFAVFAALANYFSFHVSNYIAGLRSFPERGQLISRDQVQKLLDLAEKGQPPATVLYMDEFAIEYYLTYGALDLGAVYYPALERTPELNSWLAEKEQTLEFLVNRNPIFSLPTTPDGGFMLAGDAELRVLGLQPGVRQLEVRIASSEQPASLRVSSNGADYSVVDVAAQQSWVSLPVEGDKLILEAAQGSIEVQGVRLAESAQTLWPWDQGVSLAYEDPSGFYELSLSSAQIVSRLPYNLTVLDDTGLFILAEIQQAH